MGIRRFPESSFSTSTAYPISRREDTSGSHVSLALEMTLERVSSRDRGQQEPRSGYTCGVRGFFAVDEDRGAVRGEGTVVLVTPAYCKLGADGSVSE